MLRNIYGKHWRTIIDTMLEGLMLVDPDGNIIFVNRAFEDLSGYAAEEVIGRSCEILGCDSCFGTRAKGHDKYCALFREGEVKRRKCTFVRKDGSPIQVVKNAAVIRGENNEVIGGVENLTDLSPVTEKEEEITKLRRHLKEKDGFHGMIGRTPAMERVFQMITSAASSDAPVIIYGESGTGKELVAKAIHAEGPRNNGPFVKINCAALNENLLESELFGHVKGAFTGADRTRVGRFEAAANGDIFLDEIGDMPYSTQTKLLRVLQEKEFERVGDNRPIHIDVRVISASNKDLERQMRESLFREDLFYRIGVIPIFLPPLRERVDDIPLLADYFISGLRLKSGKKIQGLNRRALEMVMGYSWPGNVRELINALEYAFVICKNVEITPAHLPAHFTRNNAFPDSVPDCAPRGSAPGFLERRQIVDALERCRGNRTEAAKILSMSRVTLWKKIKKYGIQLELK